MHTTTEISKKSTTVQAIAGAALAAIVLAALVLVRMAGSGDADQQASAGEAQAANELGRSTVEADANAPVVTIADAGPSLDLDDRRIAPPTSIVSTPHRFVDDRDDPPVDEDPWRRDPRNTPARWEVMVTPAHPMLGDEVTVEIFWSDDEADTVVAESWCHPGSGGRHGLCADDFLAAPCDTPRDGVVAPMPGSGVLRFSFTPTEPGSFGWDHSVVIRSLPADLHEDCTTYDPWQDVVFASGTIEVAPAPHGDVVDPPVWTVPVTPGDELAS